MVERLTEKIFDNNGKQQDIYEWSSASSLECNRKLGKLEDILEKYGIEDLEQYLQRVRKIDKELRDTIQQLHTIIDTIGYDRDTWQKACELACDAMTKLGGDDCCGCRLNKEMCKICENKKGLINYFYQQAKKEGEGK